MEATIFSEAIPSFLEQAPQRLIPGRAVAGSGIRSGSCLWPSARGEGKAFFSSTGIPSVAEDRRGPRRGWILFAVDRCHDSAAARSSNAPWTLAFRRACLEKFAAPGGTPVALIPFRRFAGCVQLPYRGYGWNIEWIVANWCLLYVASWKERLLDGYAYHQRSNFVQKFVYIYMLRVTNQLLQIVVLRENWEKAFIGC